MGKKRDAKTGLYISSEEAQLRDESTWVEETDSKSLKDTLQEIYNKCSEYAIKPTGGNILNEVQTVPLFNIKSILNEYGAKLK